MRKLEVYSSLCNLIFVIAIIPNETMAFPANTNDKIIRFKTDFRNKLEDARLLHERPHLGLNDHLLSLNAEIISSRYRSQSIVSWSVVNVNGEDNAFAATSDGTICILDRSQLHPIFESPHHERIYSLSAFKYNDRLWLASLYHDKAENAYYMHMYDYDFSILQERQTLLLHGESEIAISIWRNTMHLVLMTNLGDSSVLNVYSWREGQFDVVATSSPLSRFRTFVTWEKNSELFIAVSFIDWELRILKFSNSVDSNLTPIQSLFGQFHLVKNFEIDGSEYLACSSSNNITLFQWSGNEFIEHQKIFVDTEVTDILVLFLNANPVVIIGTTNKLEFLVQDSSYNYVSIGTSQIPTQGKLMSIVPLRRENSFYLLPVFKQQIESSFLSVFKLDLQSDIPLQTQPLSDFQSCAYDLDRTMKRKHEDLHKVESRLTSIWPKENDAAIKSLTVEGTVICKKYFKVKEVSFGRVEGVPSLKYLKNLYKKLQEKIYSLYQSLGEVLLKSREQTIKGNVLFNGPLEGYKIGLNRLPHHTKINGIHSSSLINALKVRENKNATGYLSIENINCSFVNTKRINNIKSNDFVLLKSSRQTIRGTLQFKDVSLHNLTVKSQLLNGLNLGHFVLSSSTQMIDNSAFFKLLSSQSISTRGKVNDVKIREFKTALRLDTSNYKHKVTLSSDAVCQNMTVKNLNGFSLSKLFEQSSRKAQNESIKGVKTFKHPLLVKNDVHVSGLINGLDLGNLLLLRYPQMLFGNFTFTNASFENIETKLVNGVQLRDQAVRKTSKLKIRKRQHFHVDIWANDIKMKDGGKLDGVDVSADLSGILKVNEPFLRTVEVNNIIVKQNVEIADSSFSELLQNVSSNVWLKSAKQTIPSGQFKLLNIEADLNVSFINKVPFSDIVLSKTDGCVNSPKQFEDMTVIENLIELGNISVNGLSVPEEFTGDVEWVESLFSDEVVFEGDILTSVLNNMHVKNLMQKNKFQICNREMSFKSVALTDFSSKSILFDFYNSTYFDAASFVEHPPRKSIRNKNFHILKGTSMNASFISNIDVNQLYHNAVTLHTSQEISKKTFSGELKMKALVVAQFLNNVNLLEVIRVDDPQRNITNKTFNGSVETTSLLVNGDVNGINVTYLDENKFIRTEDNNFTKTVIFQSSIKAEDIFLENGFKIAGVDLEDLILIAEDVHFDVGNFSDINVMNLSVDGLLNECNMSLISEFYEQSLENSIDIDNSVAFNNLRIDGDLHIQSDLNGLSAEKLPHLVLVLIMRNEIENRNIRLSNVSIHNLSISSLVNGVQVDFLLNDAVLEETQKPITGIKSFTKLFSESITLDDLNTENLCSVNVSDLFDTYLSVSKKQDIAIRNISRLSTGKVQFKGKLNGIKFPDDLVLTKTNEIISSAVQFEGNVSMISDLHVEGFVNSINLTEFLLQRVSLNSSEEISSTLIFKNDAYFKNDTIVQGTINGILLEDVLNIRDFQVLEGHKSFEKLVSMSELYVSSGLINNISLHELNESICLSTSDEDILSEVEFSFLDTPSLAVSYIENVSIDNLWNIIHDVEEEVISLLDNISHVLYHNGEHIRAIKDFTEGQTPTYAFFELHQVLNIGETVKFLPVFEAGLFGHDYELPSSEVVVWVRRNRTCTRFKSLFMKVSHNGTVQLKNFRPGRVFPFTLRIMEEDVKGFNFHTDRNWRCTSPYNQAIIARTILSDGNFSANIIETPSNSSVVDIKLLEMEGGIYVLIAYELSDPGRRIHVHSYDSVNDQWSLHQDFHTSQVSSVDLMFVDDAKQSFIYLSVTGVGFHSGIHIYTWDNFDRKFQFISHTHLAASASSLWLNTDTTVYLLLSKGELHDISDFKSIEVYTFQNDELNLEYRLKARGVTWMERFSMGEETYVLAVSHYLHTVYIIQHRGVNGFEIIQEMHTPGIQGLTLFTTLNGDMFLAIGSSTGHTRILKRILRGNTVDHN